MKSPIVRTIIEEQLYVTTQKLINFPESKNADRWKAEQDEYKKYLDFMDGKHA